VEDAGSDIMEHHGVGVDLVALIPGSEVVGRRRGTRIGRRQRRVLASACGGWLLDYGITRVDEAGTCGRLPRWWHDGLPVTQLRHKEQRRPWSKMAI
jgi:hypothetical protein